MPATNIDIFLQRTLHYVFLRHHDATVANRMNDVALSLIGNETQFDLQFKTDRVAALKGRPLRGEPIHTYCAGLLLICAQETGRPRQDFFPVPEAGAGGFCLQNLAKLGMSIGNDFVSPTGAIFSANMKAVGRCEPMYEPTREVQEAIFDHFAFAMVNKKLTPSPSASQALREKVAGLSRMSPFLNRAMARANRVSESTDLQSAARAAAVVETLDEIAMGNADEFTKARDFFQTQDEPQAATKSVLRKPAAPPSVYQQRHVNLLAKWRDGKLTPRELRMELVSYYAARGKLQLDERFFREQ